MDINNLTKVLNSYSPKSDSVTLLDIYVDRYIQDHAVTQELSDMLMDDMDNAVALSLYWVTEFFSGMDIVDKDTGEVFYSIEWGFFKARPRYTLTV